MKQPYKQIVKSVNANVVINPFLSVTENMPAIHDIWIIGDNFVQETFPALDAIKYNVQRNSSVSSTYMHDYYNVLAFNNTLATGVKLATTRIMNSLLEVVNRKDLHHLPKILLVIIDKDLMTDLEIQSSNVVNTMCDLVQWLVRQLDMVVRRKHMELLECKPEAAAGYTTKLIFVRMPRRIGTFHESSCLKAICDL